MAILDADPTVVLAYTKTEFVDEDGAPLDLTDPGWHLVSDDPSTRLSYSIRAFHFVNAALGVIRTDALRQTHLVPRYSGGDFRMMAELVAPREILRDPGTALRETDSPWFDEGKYRQRRLAATVLRRSSTGQPRRVLAPVRGPRQGCASGWDPTLAEGGSSGPARADDGHRSRSALWRTRRALEGVAVSPRLPCRAPGPSTGLARPSPRKSAPSRGQMSLHDPSLMQLDSRTMTSPQSRDLSMALAERLNSLVPGGSHTYAKGEDQYPEEMAPVLVDGRGCRVRDVDGLEYVEYARRPALGDARPCGAPGRAGGGTSDAPWDELRAADRPRG